MIWFQTHKEVEAIRNAVRALKLFNGHDSYCNLRAHYGEKWWDEINKIIKDLEEVLKS